MLQCIMKWHFSSVSICQEWLWKKCVIAALTTRWHSALRQIPRGLSTPQRTPLPREKLRETRRGRGTDKQRRERLRERERPVFLCLCIHIYKDAVSPNTRAVIWLSGFGICPNLCACVHRCACMCVYKGCNVIIIWRAHSNNYPMFKETQI